MKPVTILMLSIKPGQVGITKPMEIILTVPQIIPLRPRRSKLRQRNLKTQLYFSVVLDLPSILIRHQNGAYRKLSSNERNLNTPAFRFSVDGKHFKHGAFGKRWRHDNYVTSLEFSSNTNPKWPVIVVFLNSSGVVGQKIMRFQSKTSVFKSQRRRVDGT